MLRKRNTARGRKQGQEDNRRKGKERYKEEQGTRGRRTARDKSVRRKRGKGISKTTQQHEHREQAADDTTPPSGGDKCTPHVLATFLQGVTLSSPSLRPSFLSIAHSVRFLPFFFLACFLFLAAAICIPNCLLFLSFIRSLYLFQFSSDTSCPTRLSPLTLSLSFLY